DAPADESALWVRGGGGHGAWRRFSTSWTALLIEQIRPKAVLLLGPAATLAIRSKLRRTPIVEAAAFAAPDAGQDDAVYDAPFERLVQLPGMRRERGGGRHGGTVRRARDEPEPRPLAPPAPARPARPPPP